MHTNHPDLAQRGAVISERPERHDSNSGTEVGVLTAITSHCPTPPIGSTFCHWIGGDYPTPCYTLQGIENPLTYPAAFHPCTRSPPPEKRNIK
ncbi:hypothetical protein AVEN_67280-1, partial [Araneus ventricosus]